MVAAMELGEIKVEKKSGRELFHIDGHETNHNLLSFWQWSSSEILGNALRGVLAEYIVSMDIRCSYATRTEWDSFDLVTPDGIKVEVKSASYLQSWSQNKFSQISFGIQPTTAWNDDDTRSVEAKRQADMYVFCVLAHKDQATIDPLNLAQWDFYVLPTVTLNNQVGNQKTIRLAPLEKLNPLKCKFGEISNAIEQLNK